MVNVRGQDTLLPTTIVGSYPRPQFLRGKVFPIGGVHSPEFPDFETRALYRNAVALAIKDMTDAGLDIVTDGCQHYEMESDYEQGEIFHYYLDRLEGFVPYGDRISAGEFDNLPIYKPTCVSPIGWRRPIFKPMVEAVVEQTDKPNKIQAAVGPATMAAMITDKPCSAPTAAFSPWVSLGERPATEPPPRQRARGVGRPTAHRATGRSPSSPRPIASACSPSNGRSRTRPNRSGGSSTTSWLWRCWAGTPRGAPRPPSSRPRSSPACPMRTGRTLAPPGRARSPTGLPSSPPSTASPGRPTRWPA